MEASKDSSPNPATSKIRKSQASIEASNAQTRADARKVRAQSGATARVREAQSTDVVAQTGTTTDTLQPTDSTWASEYLSENFPLFDQQYVDVYKTNEDGTFVYVHDDETGFDRKVYLGTNLEDIEVSDSTRDLIAARAKLAEVSVKLRNGTTFSTENRRVTSLANAQAEYNGAFEKIVSDLLATLPDTYTDEQAAELYGELTAREEGALIGEESNYYLDRKQTVFQRGLERYRGLSGKSKIVAGIGVAATVAVFGAVAGPTMGLAAAGGIAGARFGRGYIKREANRKDATSIRDKQEASSLRGSNDMKLHEKKFALMNYVPYQDVDNSSNVNALILEESKVESAEKQKSAAWALGGVALGATLGTIIENARDINLRITENLPSWWNNRIEDLWSDNRIDVDVPEGDVDLNGPDVDMPEGGVDIDGPDVDMPEGGVDTDPSADELMDENEALQEDLEAAEQAAADAEEKLAQEIEKNALLQEQIEALQAQAAAEQAAEAATTEATERFGEFAGSIVSIDIPAGGNIWDQLELKVDQQNPYIDFEEKQRLVTNMLAVLQEQNPGRDMSLVYPGEHFDIDLNV